MPSLGKIKLKLSKSGHPSIISNDNAEESASQWYADSTTTCSVSPLGVKMKFTKSGDSSVVTEKYDVFEEKEKHKDKTGNVLL